MEDEFNVIGGGDNEDLVYPTDEPLGGENVLVNESSVLSELNGLGRRSIKRRFNDQIDDDEEYVHPIDWHMKMPISLEEREAKRQKQLLEEDIIERMTSKIIECRSKRVSLPGVGEFSTNYEEEEEKVMRFPPTDGSKWIGVSTDDSEDRFYIRIKSKNNKISRNFDSNRRGLRTGRALADLLEEEKVLRTDLNRRRELVQETVIENIPSTSAEANNLWVNKYSPRHFPELLGDDGINRNVLIWLKLWDECVFKKKVGDLESLVNEREREIYSLDTGKPRRPNNKVLLLSGAAGLGKTTLAGVIARHCGYATVEMNASDSRNIPDFDRVIEGAVRSTKNIDSKTGGKPNCLILDEIDGAPGEAVRHLVKILQMTGKKAIRRPIICICNNLFAPCLRELRAIALNINVLPTRKDRLVDRLGSIADQEHVRIDNGALSHLVELCHCDVRLSLNLLQFVAYAAREERQLITISDVEKAAERENIGAGSIFDHWATILDFSKHLDNKGTLLTIQRRLRTIEKTVASCGDDRFVSGLHANFVRLPLPIGVLVRALNCFLFYDKVNLTIAQTQNYSMMRYMMAFYANLHITVATHHRAQLKYPQLEQTVVQRSRESLETLNTVRQSLITASNPTCLVLDVLPLIVTIVQPALKPMNEHLYSSRELTVISSVVKIMSSYNLTYAPSTVNGQVHYTFQPQIDVLTLYNLADVNHRVCLSNTMRQMIVKKVEQHKTKAMIAEVSENLEKGQAAPVPKNKSMDYVVLKKDIPNRVPLHYKYNQGFSNAVKKSIRMSYFVV